MIFIGFGYLFHCPHCGEATYLALGTGNEYTVQNVFYGNPADPPLIKDFTTRQTYQKALEYLNQNGVPDTKLPGSYGHKIYYCPECRTLKVHFYFSIATEEKPWHPKYKCELCKEQLILAPGQRPGDDPEKFKLIGEDREVLRIHCDKCGKIYFATESGCTSKIHWE
ncbi:hypothetical protein McpSp1_13410 [Methanocorpusculaceae archaeon Sp1]|uniref:Uncharacterized protein n=1 Tax=Methanorbis furvi TaxID=3028299 RepID=A0AAE4MAJ2_9EURY|nr:hypothetical protein [Methanocorpusculaceae archaeon Sp1]MDV0441280.1 hypothetical protein [Methanocorpusculaceae archaeon Ag1]